MFRPWLGSEHPRFWACHDLNPGLTHPNSKQRRLDELSIVRSTATVPSRTRLDDEVDVHIVRPPLVEDAGLSTSTVPRRRNVLMARTAALAGDVNAPRLASVAVVDLPVSA